MHIEFRKKIFLVLISFIVLIFTSCKSINHNYKYYDSHCGIATKTSNGDYYQIHSEEEKNVFLGDHSLNIKFISLLNSYDENYFSTKYIVILVMPASSSSVQYILTDIHIEEDIEFEIKKKSKEISSEDLVNKAFVVEFSKNLSDKDCKIFIKK